ncbi:MAG: hypothetical protein AB7U35_13600 [Sphingobium sp.]
MTTKSHISKILLAGCATAALSACGADDIASPGTGGNITINNPSPTPSPTPTPTPTPSVVAAGGCPTIADPAGLTDRGTLTSPQGSWRVCELPAQFTASTTLPKIAGLLYSLGGRVDVGSDLGTSGGSGITLTIDPGVIVFGNTGVSWLAVNRGNKIQAVGTASQPIIFTSRDNALGISSDTSSGQWGGVVLLGRAPITDCAAPSAAPGTTACERDTEGASSPALYGGATANDSSGRMSYVQIRYSGYVLSADKELQGLTPSGIGTGTVLDHIQIHNSSDDGIEFFGGSPQMKNVVITGAEDDSLDIDTGAKALIQYVIAVQRTDKGDSMIEGDSDNSFDVQNPRTNLRLTNFTFLANALSGNGAAIMMRGGMDANLSNGVVVSPGQPCLQLRNAKTIAAADAADDNLGPPIFNSVVMQCSSTPYASHSTVTAAQTQTIFESGSNNNAAFTPSLTAIVTGSAAFVNGANETGATAIDPKTVNAFFDTTNYVGAVKDAADTWYQGWTCNSSTASFGGSSTACTVLPTA